MRLLRREPFFGQPEDVTLLPASERERFEVSHSADSFSGRTLGFGPSNAGSTPASATHPDAVEKGTEIALGFVPHDGESRKQRRAAVATWVPPKLEGEQAPTRRELRKQRVKQRRGKLDIETRRLQRKATK